MSDTEAREKLAALLADDWNPERDPILTAMFRDYAHTILAAGWRPPSRVEPGSDRCPTCGCEFAYHTAIHVLDCGEGE